MLAYACVYSFYNQDTEHMDMVEQQTENLELHTNALQILLGEAWAPACSLPPPAHLPALSSPSPQTVGETAPPSQLPTVLCPLPPPTSSQPYRCRYIGLLKSGMKVCGTCLSGA